MPEVIVTKTLSDTIKNYRKEIKMRGDTLSKRLRKNTSFISQLETGKLKTIDTDILYEIFDILLENESAVNKNKKLSEILDNIGLTLSEKELEHQNWMHIFDLQYRIIPIPKSIVSFIEKNVKDYSLNTTSIVKEINRNIPLFDSFSKNQIDELEDNRVYCECTSNSTHTYIKFNLPEDYINDIIAKRITRCNFVNMHIIIISILSRTENLDYNTAYDRAEQFLFENKFYTLLQKQRISSTNPDNLAPYDIDFSKNMSKLNSIFDAINDKQPGFLTETDILKNFVKNLKEEPTITLSIISKNISDLSNMDRENKKSFVKDFSKLIEQYQIKASDDDHKIETF